MNKPLIIKLFILFSMVSTSTITFADSWKGKDKDQHMIAGAAIGSLVTTVTDSPIKGCVAASSVGLIKEIYDYQHKQKHTPSFKDFAVTAVAGCLVSQGTHVLVTHNKIILTWKF